MRASVTALNLSIISDDVDVVAVEDAAAVVDVGGGVGTVDGDILSLLGFGSSEADEDIAVADDLSKGDSSVDNGEKIV